MRFKFLHFGDCHLGYRQYDHPERYNDFGKAFLHVIDAAVAEKVDFAILAGDLFHKRSIDARTLNQAMVGLDRLQKAGIPCIAVEGNHELAYLNDQVGWLHFLGLRGYVTLLTPDTRDGQFVLGPHTNRAGSYVDVLPGVRVHGLKYLGGQTNSAVQRYAAALAEQPQEGVHYTIFVAHAGVEGVVPGASAGLTMHEWSVLRPHVDYLALGHVHKRYEFDGWVYNPGSLESCNIMESDWADRGFNIVTVDTDLRTVGTRDACHTCAARSMPRRAFRRVTVKVDLSSTPEELAAECERAFRRRAHDGTPADAPVVEVALSGVLQFDRAVLNINAIRKQAQEEFGALLVLMKDGTASNSSIVTGEARSRQELEREVIHRLLLNDGRFRPHAEAWTGAILELKQLAVSGASPGAVVAELQAQLERIRAGAAM
jgi:DNA repair exonuclease SbcCD nuclease subunit